MLSTGGIYLGGGIPPRILALLKKEIFTKTLLDKGRFTEVLANMPIKVIMNTKAPLMGGGIRVALKFRRHPKPNPPAEIKTLRAGFVLIRITKSATQYHSFE
ncbi:MAG: glucokinase [Anaerolineales bacterium]|nr:glucokinase [Anaerolineales bacterium]